MGIAPACGGKITSLLDRRTGREWLAQPTSPLSAAGYGATFTDADMSGWDEMLPTIVGGPNPAGPGTLPDHGEVWSIPWEVLDASDDRIVAAVSGRRLPYRLRRAAQFMGEDGLRLSYELHVEGPEPMPLLWAAHPQLTWRKRTRVELPADVSHVLDVTTGPEPHEVSWDGLLPRYLDHARAGEGRKVWLRAHQRPSGCILRDVDGGTFQLSWDPDVVPYLGVWYDARAYSREPVVALEPSTGFYDDLSFAVANGRVPMVTADRPLRWTLDVRLHPGVPAAH